MNLTSIQAAPNSRGRLKAPLNDFMSRRLQTYEGEGFAVTFDPNVCIHSANCIRGLPAVFDVRRKRWVAVESASPGEIEEQIGRCPSGALQFIRVTTS